MLYGKKREKKTIEIVEMQFDCVYNNTISITRVSAHDPVNAVVMCVYHTLYSYDLYDTNDLEQWFSNSLYA